MNPLEKKEARISINPSYNDESAFNFFLENSTLTLLTDTSIGCITITAKLKDETISPYYKLRIDKWREPVKTILIKLMLYDDKSKEVTYKKISKIRKEEFEISTKKSFYTEVNNQIKISTSSFTNSLDPLCPTVLFYEENIDTKKWLELLNKQKQTLKTSIFSFLGKLKNEDIIIEFLNAKMNKSIIVMEFFDNCLPLSHFNIFEKGDFTKKQRDEYLKYYCYAIYTTIELRSMGYEHGDLHSNNILICPKEKYFTAEDNKNIGRAFIIDFGRTKYDIRDDKRYDKRDDKRDKRDETKICENMSNILEYEKFAIEYKNNLRGYFVDQEIEDSLCDHLKKLDKFRNIIVPKILKIVEPILSDETKITKDAGIKYAWWYTFGGAVYIGRPNDFLKPTLEITKKSKPTLEPTLELTEKSKPIEKLNIRPKTIPFERKINEYLEDEQIDEKLVDKYLEDALNETIQTDIIEVIKFNINQINIINDIIKKRSARKSRKSQKIQNIRKTRTV